MEDFGKIIEVGIDHRRDEQGEQEAEGLTTDDDDGDGAAFLRARAGAQREGNHPGHQRERGHQDGTEAVAIAVHDGLQALHPGAPERVHVVNLEDGVLLHDAEEHQQAERGVEVQRVVRHPEREEREGQ